MRSLLLVLFTIITSTSFARAEEPAPQSASERETQIASIEEEVAVLHTKIDALEARIALLKGEQPKPARFYGFFGEHMHLEGAVDPQAVWDMITRYTTLFNDGECSGRDKGGATFFVGLDGRVSWVIQDKYPALSRCVKDVIMGLQFPTSLDDHGYTFRLIDF